MTSRTKIGTPSEERARLGQIQIAIVELRNARARLATVGAPQASDYVARALKSAEGAERHAHNRVMRARRIEEATP